MIPRAKGKFVVAAWASVNGSMPGESANFAPASFAVST